MNFIRHSARALAALAAIPVLGVNPAPAVADTPLPGIREAVFFGDSLTDAGTYGFRFTTNPGMTWAQHVAAALGQSIDPNEHVVNYDAVYQGKPGLPGPGGLNYAEGGARADAPYSTVSQNAQGTPISTNVQLSRFLAQHQAFAPDQLVTLYIGTNDVALNYDPRFKPQLAQNLRDNHAPDAGVMAAERARVQQAARAAAHTASEILAKGAQHLVVFTLFDLAVLPWFESQASRDYVHTLGLAYNDALTAALPRDPRIQVLDMGAFVDDLLANLGRYGFTHGANEDACAQPGQDYCGPDAWKEPDADRTFVFAASEHFTTHAHELLADYVQRQVGAHLSGS
jgi:phospholipase/lecithinase/hemolysin